MFGDDVAQFIDEIYDQGPRLHTHAGRRRSMLLFNPSADHSSFDPSLEPLKPSSQTPLPNNQDSEYQGELEYELEQAQTETEILTWFADQLHQAKGLPYMDFRQP